mgnify:CR=1 FL=1
MTKKILFGVLALSLLIACNNQNTEEATAITTSEFATVASDMLDKTVSIEGTVMHVCKHGGKKMFINEDRVKVIASEKLAAFDQALEGSTIIVTGIIREEAVPVLTEQEVVPAEETPADEVAETGIKSAEECEMEKVKPLYVIEVIDVTEKVN